MTSDETDIEDYDDGVESAVHDVGVDNTLEEDNCDFLEVEDNEEDRDGEAQVAVDNAPIPGEREETGIQVSRSDC